MTARCSYIKPSGGRCKGVPVRGSALCAAHHPDYRASRRAGARRGGMGRANREIGDLKGRILQTVDAVLDGTLDRGRAAVGIQGLNALRAALELERKIKETEELEARIAELEQRGRTDGPRQEAL